MSISAFATRPIRQLVLLFIGACGVCLFLLAGWGSQSGLNGTWSNGVYKRENATLVTLCRNEDLPGLVDTIRSYEDRFNRKFHYDWIFLNNDEFTEEFKNITSQLVSGEAKFGIIPPSMWSYPSYIDQDKAAKSREQMEHDNILYGGSESYRHMCRFQSGFFYRHPLVLDYKYYWRVDGDTRVHCDIDYDVFKYMRENGKRYGFVIAIYEFIKTIPTLWSNTMAFTALHPSFVQEDNLMNFISDDGVNYNLCHFWSNFEIADADFFRDAPFDEYFEFLDKTGGFFYERWGDAPVHSIAAALFLKKDEVHFFEDIGFSHNPYTHVPENFINRPELTCSLIPSRSFDWDGYSCMRQYYRAMSWPLPEGV